jgi:hypothetical protein
MDGMRFGLDRPQEDEWAMALLGLGSPYETIAFPDGRPVRPEFLGLDGIGEVALRRWEAGFRRFLQAVQFRAERNRRDRRDTGARHPLLLKSPTHTARLTVLCRMFPRARFIHLARDPIEIFASTVRLWTVLFDIYGCQKPHRGALPGGVPSIDEYVLRTLPLLYRGFEQASAAVPRERWYDLRYEDLADDPIGEVERVYRHFRLGAFETVRPRLLSYLDKWGEGRSVYDLPAELRSEIAGRWAEYARRYGY